MKALEQRADILAMSKIWKKAFCQGAEIIGKMEGYDIFWHEQLGIWGAFGKTSGRGGSIRDWHPFGQKSVAFRSNIVVEINQSPIGINRMLNSVFALDNQGQKWILHSGRMNIRGGRVSETDFIDATDMAPTDVVFSDGSYGQYHKVANLTASPAAVQESIAAYIAQCARARLIKLAEGAPVPNLTPAFDWERGFNAETIGSFNIPPHGGGKGYRIHGEILKALAAELEDRGIRHSNDRVGRYGPDLFTYGTGSKVLFEIKSRAGAHDVFEAVGQLQIYDQLLGGGYKKVLVIPEGMAKKLKGSISILKIDMVEFNRHKKKTIFDKLALTKCLE